MDQASIQFIAFGLIVALISNVHHSQKWRSAVLLLASLLFLALLAHDLFVLVPLIAFLLMGYATTRWIARGPSYAAPISISVAVFSYVWLKKYTFLPAQILLHFPYFTLGLSYIFFRVLHLLIESRDESVSRPIVFTRYLTYTLNFTTFVSGPIQRYDDFAADQFTNQSAQIGPRIIGAQIERILRGFFKVNVLALLLNMIQTDARTQIAQPLSSEKLSAAIVIATLYPFFLYANFSGYIDIVIGIARLLRLRLPENFDRPFSSRSFIEFWNRWHITLSAWLKMYVYNPLLVALMRRNSSATLEPFLAVFCFFTTFFLVGIWHGRTSEFVFFGVLQGGGVAINKLWQIKLASILGRKPHRALLNNYLYGALARGLTFTWFSFTLFWFWSNWKQIGAIYSALEPAEWIGVWGAVWTFATIVLALWEWLRARTVNAPNALSNALNHRYARVVIATIFAVFAFIFVALLNQPAPDIIYKAF